MYNRGFFFFQAEDGIRDIGVTGVQTCALPISRRCGGIALAFSRCSASAPTARRSTGRGRPSVRSRRRSGGRRSGSSPTRAGDRKSVVLGKRVDLGGGRFI